MWKHLIELFVADALWGFSFVAAKLSFEALSPSATVFYRFAISCLVAGFLVGPKNFYRAICKYWKVGGLAGFLISLVFHFQLSGLLTTTVSKSAFITSLYIVFVPVFTLILTKQKIAKGIWAAILVGLFGISLISEVWTLGTISRGDFLTLISSFVAAAHIWYLSLQAPKIENAFQFNFVQLLFGGLFSLFLGLPDFTFHPASWNLVTAPQSVWFGLLTLAIGVNLIAFGIQVRVQKVMSPEVVSLLFLLESPISFIFAYAMFNEKLSLSQSLGCGLLFLAGFLSVILESKTIPIDKEPTSGQVELDG